MPRPKGNGPGLHGPANGSKNPPGGFVNKPPVPYTADSPTRTAHLDNHDPNEQAYRQQQVALKRERKRKAWEALDALVDDRLHPAHFNGIRETLNRVEGVPVQKTELTGKDGAPIQTVGITTNDPVEAARVYQQLMGGQE